MGAFGGDGGPATAASLNHPVAISFDSSGNLAIADWFVIATARNARHAQAIGRELLKAAKGSGSQRRLGSSAVSTS